MKEEYGKFSCDKLRKLALNSKLEHEHMSQPLYESLLDNEASFDEPSADILEFCVAGLKQFDEYKGYEDSVIWGNSVAKRLKSERGLNPNNSKAGKITFRKPKARRLVFIVAAIVIVGTLAGCAVIAGMYGWFLDLPLFTRTEQNGYEYLRTDSERFYESMDSMLKLENLNIFYPVELPNGYKFTDFEVADFEDDFEIRAYASEPYIFFSVRLGANVQIDDYTDEINGIKYSVFGHEEKFQAYWSIDEDFYTVAVSDEAMLSEIINNLEKWEG